MTIDLEKANEIVARFKDVEGALLECLHALQHSFGYVPAETLDIMADGWWHMSIANRMIQENTLLLQFHPFANVQSTGFEIFYPPLWHLQLALISEVSGVILPWVWHFVAAVNVSMLLLIFYKLSLVLSQDRRVAFGAVCLHIVLVGGLNTYF
ncbi:MAG: hypothetical protein HOH18_13850, partial [Kordiimonadaceae bacterium]|nr:hypothetical protein [Kordiimonadaceae bacterium]